VTPNLLNQNFVATKVDEVWLADITYIPTTVGWLYLAVVIDLYSRKIVGWAMNDSLHRQLVLDALQMAITVRKPAPGLLHHSDRGCQYASAEYQALLTQSRMMGTVNRESQRQLLRQRAQGKFLGHPENGAGFSPALCHPGRGQI